MSESPDGSPVVPYFVFLVRPDGIRPYYEIRARLEPLGIAFGYELIEQDLKVDVPDYDNLATWDGTIPLDEPLMPAPAVATTAAGDGLAWPSPGPGRKSIGGGAGNELAGRTGNKPQAESPGWRAGNRLKTSSGRRNAGLGSRKGWRNKPSISPSLPQGADRGGQAQGTGSSPAGPRGPEALEPGKEPGGGLAQGTVGGDGGVQGTGSFSPVRGIGGGSSLTRGSGGGSGLGAADGASAGADGRNRKRKRDALAPGRSRSWRGRAGTG